MQRRPIAMARLIAGLVVMSHVGVGASVSPNRAHRLNRQNLGVISSAERRARPGSRYRAWGSAIVLPFRRDTVSHLR
jgi:hypothetical protein